jgi:hypothetical protein
MPDTLLTLDALIQAAYFRLIDARHDGHAPLIELRERALNNLLDQRLAMEKT